MLVQYYKNAKILKRSSRLKGRPEWQDVVPDSKEGRDAYAIAAKHEKDFSRAFKKAIQNLLPEKMTPEFKDGWEKKSPTLLLSALPISSEDSPAWKKFKDELASAYAGVIEESGKVTTEDLNKKFKTSLGFTMTDRPVEEVEKAAKKKVVVVPVNPYSVKWIDTHGLELAKNLSLTQSAVTRSIIEEAFSKGLRAEEIYESIRQNIGLTERDLGLVRRRADLLEEQGYQSDDIKRMVSEYRDDRLDQRSELIARTETISAQARGREDAWQVAKDSGQLPAVKRVWVSAPESPNPNRPCEICLDLNGKEAELGEPYESLDGPIDGPTAHPGCLPGESLVFSPKIVGTSQRKYIGDLIIFQTALGNKLACTPNHVILGRQGWIPAKKIQSLDYVVGCFRTEGKSPFINPDYYDSPVPIQEISETFGKSCKMPSIPVPISPKDFHGDGKGSDIAIIRSDGLLRKRAYLSLFKHFYHRNFTGTFGRPVLFSQGKFASFFKSYFSSCYCAMCRFGIFSMLFRRSLFHHHSIGDQIISDTYSRNSKQAPDFLSADSKGFCDRVLGFSTQIALDQIIRIDVQRFSGPVFNIETSHSWYIAQNIFNHNCRCTEILVRA